MADDAPPPPPEDAPSPLADLRFNRLLVALDGSASAELALAAAVTAAHHSRARLTLLVVVADVATESAVWLSGAANPHLLQEQVDDEAARTLRRALARVPEDISITTRVRRGKAGPEIVAQATEDAYDAIFLGARGRGRVATLIGSVSSHVLHHAPIAVFVAHAPANTGPGGRVR